MAEQSKCWLELFSGKQAGQAFPGNTPGAAAPFDSVDPAIVHHTVDGAPRKNQDFGCFIRPKKPFFAD
jgi:hypothetical protein